MMWRKIIWERSGGHWLFYCSVVYLSIGLYCAIYYKEIPTALIQLFWILAISMPLYFPPLGRWLNMNIDWDKKMLDWFKNKSDGKVVKFPETKVPYVEPPAPPKEKEAHTYYRLGLTDNNRVSFSMGYSEITMNADGIDNLIKQLECFKSLLQEDSDDN